jgi:hypothetical protein
MMMANRMQTLRGSLPSAVDVLHHVGLERERPATSGITVVVVVFALGAVAGATIAATFTLRAREAIRQALRTRLRARGRGVAAPATAVVDASPNADGAGRASDGTAPRWPEGAANAEAIA